MSKKDCLLDHVELSVSEAEKRVNGALNIREHFIVYLIESKVKDAEFTKINTKLGTIWRRYTEFEQLRNYLEATYPYIILPPLPEKRVLYSWSKSGSDTLDPDFVERRRASLEVFLKRIANHPALCYDDQFLGFLQQDEGWRDTCKDTGYLQLTESKLRALTTLNVRGVDERFEAIEEYAIELETHLNSLLKARVKLAERIYIIHKLHANYGRVFSEWSACEKKMGDGLQKAGHYMDTFAAEIDSLLEEEESLADQLKEYLFFAASLLAICKRRSMLQAQLEKAQSLLDFRVVERDSAVQGKTGFISRILGSVDSEEVRESKVNTTVLRVKESRHSVQTAQEELSEFTREALADYDRFQNEKVADVKKTLLQYAMLQAKLSKQCLAAWTHAKEGIEAMP